LVKINQDLMTFHMLICFSKEDVMLCRWTKSDQIDGYNIFDGDKTGDYNSFFIL
jgi:hypothetical protein